MPTAVGNTEALYYAYNLAKDQGLRLLVKPHPAETNKAFVKEIYDLKDELKFSFTNENTMKLIINAQKIITINSTVGLEALIAMKKAHVLGRAVYKGFNETDLAKYILGYLIDINYFAYDDISEIDMLRLLERSSENNNAWKVADIMSTA